MVAVDCWDYSALGDKGEWTGLCRIMSRRVSNIHVVGAAECMLYVCMLYVCCMYVCCMYAVCMLILSLDVTTTAHTRMHLIIHTLLQSCQCTTGHTAPSTMDMYLETAPKTTLSGTMQRIWLPYTCNNSDGMQLSATLSLLPINGYELMCAYIWCISIFYRLRTAVRNLRTYTRKKYSWKKRDAAGYCDKACQTCVHYWSAILEVTDRKVSPNIMYWFGYIAGTMNMEVSVIMFLARVDCFTNIMF